MWKYNSILRAILIFYSGCSLGGDGASVLTGQLKDLPHSFREYVFQQPLISRVEVDNKVLGEAMVMLFDSGKIQIINFIDGEDPVEQERLQNLFSTPVTLGVCQAHCPDGMTTVSYSISESVLSIRTKAAEQDIAEYEKSPLESSSSVILNNQLNMNADKENAIYGSYYLKALGSAAGWSWSSIARVDKYSNGKKTRYDLDELNAAREFQGYFLKVGVLQPGSHHSTGASLPSSGSSQLIGIEGGTSDIRLIEKEAKSQVPLYVTANQSGAVEVYRNGSLIYTQQLKQGVQEIDTTGFPTGIYPVSLRILENGKVVNEYTETVYKNRSWSNPNRKWSYSIFGGREIDISSERARQKPEEVLGASLSQLLHPTLIASVSGRYVNRNIASGLSLNWNPNDASNLYGSISTAGKGERAWQIAASHQMARANVSLRYEQQEQKSNLSRTRKRLSLNGRYSLGRMGNLSASLSHENNNGTSGTGVDLGYYHNMNLWETDVGVNVSVFDRPYGNNGLRNKSRRNQGAMVSLTFPLGARHRQYYVQMSTQNSVDGERDQRLTLGMTQSIEDSFFKNASANLQFERRGLSSYASVGMEGYRTQGDAFVQYTSAANQLYGSLNLSNTVAMNAQGLTMSSAPVSSRYEAGMILDVDADEPDINLYARDSMGGTYPLQPGKNFIPVQEWKRGKIEVDYQDKNPLIDAPALQIKPGYHDYFMVKGAVVSKKISVVKTVTVLGQLLDATGEAVSGARITNHAGKTTSGEGGIFTLEVGKKNTVIDVQYPDGQQCKVGLDIPAQSDNALIEVGQLTCSGTAALSADLKKSPQSIKA